MIDEAVAAIRAGKPVILPTDTVYGLVTTPHIEDAVRGLYRVKGRDETQPSALVASDVGTLFECVPELRGRAETQVRALLPGPLTLVLPNPARRFPWLTGSRPETIGVRVPRVDGSGGEVLRRVGAVVATSANHPGEADPARVADIPEEIRGACAAVIDAGELRGTPSTVIDLTGEEAVVLREGAFSAAEALERLRGAAV